MRKLVHTYWPLALAALALALGCLVSATVIHASYGVRVFSINIVGIDFVAVDSDGAVVAVSNHAWYSPSSKTYISRDGGLYWTLSPLEPDYEGPNYAAMTRGGDTAVTPKGTYSLRPNGIWLSKDGISELVYPTEFLSGQSSIWIQEIETRRTIGYLPFNITETPYEMVYDDSSDNVIVVMGLLGALIGTPEGEWLQVDVGNFTPVDFSRPNKLDTLITRHWASFLALSISVVAAASAISNLRRRDVLWGAVATIGAILVASVLSNNLINESSLMQPRYRIFGAACALLIGSLAYAAFGRSALSRTQLMVSMALAVCGASLSLAALPSYRHDTVWIPPVNYGATLVSLQAFAIASAVGSAALLRSRTSELALTRGAVVVVGLAVFSIFVAWLADAIPLDVAYIATASLAVASCVALSVHLRRNRQIEV